MFPASDATSPRIWFGAGRQMALTFHSIRHQLFPIKERSAAVVGRFFFHARTVRGLRVEGLRRVKGEKVKG